MNYELEPIFEDLPQHGSHHHCLAFGALRFRLNRITFRIDPRWSPLYRYKTPNLSLASRILIVSLLDEALHNLADHVHSSGRKCGHTSSPAVWWSNFFARPDRDYFKSGTAGVCDWDSLAKASAPAIRMKSASVRRVRRLDAAGMAKEQQFALRATPRGTDDVPIMSGCSDRI